LHKLGPITTALFWGYVKSLISVLKIAKKVKHFTLENRYIKKSGSKLFDIMALNKWPRRSYWPIDQNAALRGARMADGNRGWKTKKPKIIREEPY
jgi:hypothetical protein